MADLPRLDVEVSDIRAVDPFTYRWPGPNDDVETYDRVWVAKARIEERVFKIRHGLGRREAFGRDRVRGVTWVDGQPMVEGAGADDYELTRDLISIVKLPDGTQAHTPDELPAEYRDFQVASHAEAIRGPRQSRALAIRVREDDVSAWARYAATRRALKQDRRPAAPDPVLRSAITRGRPVLADVELPKALPPQTWIEKTLVRGRADRQSGERALGRALWSPRADQRGVDTYRFMRDVRAGDLVLHLTDNEAFVGTSRAARTYTEGAGVAGTAWPGDAYIVDLEGYKALDPPLSRHDLLDGPLRPDLEALLQSGAKNLFFNRNLELNQGAYLTPVPLALANILNAAYMVKTGRVLIDMDVELPVVEMVDPKSLGERFSAQIAATKLTFGKDQETLLRSFLASLLTKPLVILTGLSGSGKTQLAIKFGEWLGDGRYLVEAVRPDWTGSEALFGYEDAFKSQSPDGRRAWTVPRVLEFMMRAARDQTQPFLLILDEMNLAHVERYFADFLSGMESQESVLPNLTREADGEWRVAAQGPSRIPVPKNLFVVGTVNVDETTYMFSPKVLDRANTFEFRVRTDDLAAPVGELAKGPPASASVRKTVLAVALDRSPSPIDVHQNTEFGQKLVEFHALLSRGGFEFGYRVFYEALRFAANFSLIGGDERTALDLQLLQKALPRLHGSRRRLEPVLLDVGRFCYELADPGEGSSPESFDAWFGLLGPPPAPPELPRSFDKVRRILRSLRANQFVSFTE